MEDGDYEISTAIHLFLDCLIEPQTDTDTHTFHDEKESCRVSGQSSMMDATVVVTVRCGDAMLKAIWKPWVQNQFDYTRN